MSDAYQRDRNFAQRYEAQQKEIIGPVLVKYTMVIADFHTDTTEATDLTILRGPIGIGLRVRRFGYAHKYGLLDFTIRSFRSSGVPTEIDKITQGKCGWFAYFHEDENGKLPHWLIVDLDGFRAYPRPGREYPNVDGTTRLKVYRVTDFPVGILIGASDSVMAILPPLYVFAVGRRQRREWFPYEGIKI
jgi:hypothetical protein